MGRCLCTVGHCSHPNDGSDPRTSFTRSTRCTLSTKRSVETHRLLLRRQLDRPPALHVWSRMGVLTG